MRFGAELETTFFCLYRLELWNKTAPPPWIKASVSWGQNELKLNCCSTHLVTQTLFLLLLSIHWATPTLTTPTSPGRILGEIIHCYWFDSTGQNSQLLLLWVERMCLSFVSGSFHLAFWDQFMLLKCFTNLSMWVCKSLRTQTKHPCFTYTEPCHESVAGWGFMLRACVQVQHSNHEMTSIPDIDLAMPLGHTAKILQPRAESKKKYPEGSFSLLYSPSSTSLIRHLLLTNVIF